MVTIKNLGDGIVWTTLDVCLKVFFGPWCCSVWDSPPCKVRAETVDFLYRSLITKGPFLFTDVPTISMLLVKKITKCPSISANPEVTKVFCWFDPRLYWLFVRFSGFQLVFSVPFLVVVWSFASCFLLLFSLLLAFEWFLTWRLLILEHWSFGNQDSGFGETWFFMQFSPFFPDVFQGFRKNRATPTVSSIWDWDFHYKSCILRYSRFMETPISQSHQ